MDFESANQIKDDLVKLIKSQKPISIIQFGSSLNKDDFIPGISDLNLMIISNNLPIKVKDKPYLNITNVNHDQFQNGLNQGNSEILNAFYNGKVLYDDKQFIKVINSLPKNDFPRKTTIKTLYGIAQSLSDDLSSAMNRYFSSNFTNDNKTKLLRNLYSTIKKIGIFNSTMKTEKLISGHNQVLEYFQKEDSELAGLLNLTKYYLLNPEELSQEESNHILIEDDGLGQIIQVVENEYINKLNVNFAKIPTNDLIKEYQKQMGEIKKTFAVRINNYDFNHLILGQRNNGDNCIYGIINTNDKDPYPVQEDLPAFKLKKEYQKIHITK